METLIVLLGLVVLAVPVLLLVMLVKLSSLKHRVAALEESLEDIRLQPTVAESPQPQPQASQARVEPAAAPSSARAAFEQAPAALVETGPVPPPLPERAPLPLQQQDDADEAIRARVAEAAARVSHVSSQPAEPNFIERGIERIKQWFTTGNVPIKVGMLVMLAGVAALLKYASDAGWLRMPIEFRLAGIAAAALAALVFAWRKRESHRAFALALQGGAIGVLLLTVFAAYKNYGLIDSLPAFALSVVLVAGLCVMAVLQESRTLAILGTLAGFMAPIWLSDGSGNHVGLFSYYALLNAGIFAIAWLRPWRVLNLLGFVFTFGIGTMWGVLQYRPEKFNSTEPFLLLFFAFYLLLPLLYARKQATKNTARIDGCLLFGTPLVAFSLQAALLEGERMPLALCALGVAVLYAVLAKWLIGRERYDTLARGYAILAVGFATLAVPLALSARATASVFALEGAGLVWLGLQQQHRLARWSGIGLQLAAAFALVVGLSGGHVAMAVANPVFMGALLIALAAFATAWLYRREGNDAVATVAYAWGLLWWLGNGVHEIDRFIRHAMQPDVVLMLVAVTGWIAAEVQLRKSARALALTALGALVLGFPLALWQTAEHQQPMLGYGALAWAVFAVLGVRNLLCLRVGDGRIAALAQLAWWLLWPTVLSLMAWYIGKRFELAEGWVALLLALPWLALAAVSLQRWVWLARPLGAGFDAWKPVLQGIVFAVLGLWWLRSLISPGDASPLPWIVVFNPLDLAQIAVLVLLARWLWRGHRLPPLQLVGLAVAALVLVTVMTLRAVHHWGGEPWSDHLLGSKLAQTSLTVVWSMLGVIGWVSGSRRGQWGLWLAGAILMGVVLAKLLLVDRGNLGDLLGIGAFIAYGLLCTLVGWLAPAPPRRVAVENNGGTPA
ncbi:MAG: DUF2339 domain-containing protein [Pseudoxanthomonas sp.]